MVKEAMDNLGELSAERLGAGTAESELVLEGGLHVLKWNGLDEWIL